MKNLRKVFSIVISLAMVLSLFGAFSVQASETEYTFYTQVGESFTPVTEGVTWNNTDTIDTSVMGRQVIYGTDSEGATVKGIINVGVQKWNSYQNNEGKTADSTIGTSSSSTKDEWRYASGSDGAELATYVQDPENSNNIVVKYTGGLSSSTYVESTGKYTNTNYNQIHYYPATQTTAGNSYSIDFKFRADSAGLNATAEDTYSIVFRNSSNYDTFNLKYQSNDGGRLQMTLYGADKETATVFGKIDEWLNFKYMVYSVTNDDSSVTIKSCIFLDDTKIAEVTTNMNNSDSIVPILYMQIKNASNQNRTVGTRFASYLDDMKITDLGLTTKEYIYYDSFDDEYNYDYLQADGTQAMDINETVNFVTEAGEDSGYSTEVYASAVADTSKLGAFKSTTALPGFDEPINISWTVYKEQLTWEENFENYTETDIGKTPYRLPWLSGSSGKTIAYENAEAETKNTVLSYSAGSVDSDWLKMGDGKSIEGKFSVEWKFMLPELKANSTFTFPLIRESGHPFVEPAASVNASGNGQFDFAYYNAENVKQGTIYPVESGQLKAKQWYKVKFTIDTAAQTFTYAFDDVEYSEKYGARYQNNSSAQEEPSFTQFRLAQRNASLSETATIYVDDIKVERILTIQAPVAQSITVYKGDEAALPSAAAVLLTDGETTDEAEVAWNGNIDTSAVGTKTITGVVTGTSTPATLNVEVSAYPYEIVYANFTNGSTEVFGLIKGGALSSVTLNKIANDTKAGRVYAAVYDADEKLIGANVISIDTDAVWSKDENKDIAITLNLPNSEEIDIDTCTLKLFVISNSLVPFAEVKAQSNTDTQAATTVWIAGDSLAEEKSSDNSETGWGEAFETLCAAAGITVENKAIGGRSSKSFYDQGFLRDILNEAKEGDYLFIQFGHNDSKSTDETRYTTYTEGGTFEQYMTKYVTEARSKGVIPVILTPVVRAKWPTVSGVANAGTTFIGATDSYLDDYAAAAKRVAAEYHVPMLDIHTLTNEFVLSKASDSEAWTDAEKEAVWAYYDVTDTSSGTPDTTHLNEEGAELVANMIIEEMENIRLPLYKLFNN